ncbi:MAG: RNA recognition motif domain-containing protein [Candidatus Margulisiibacteriota bacterium]
MNIFVGNLAYAVSEQELREAFEAYGSVSSAKVIIDKMTGQSRGFGFVEMTSNDEGQQAIQELNGKDLKGRRMNVNEAKPKENAPRRGEYVNN